MSVNTLAQRLTAQRKYRMEEIVRRIKAEERWARQGLPTLVLEPICESELMDVLMRKPLDS